MNTIPKIIFLRVNEMLEKKKKFKKIIYVNIFKLIELNQRGYNKITNELKNYIYTYISYSNYRSRKKSMFNISSMI